MSLPDAEFPSSRTKDGALYLDNAATSFPKPLEVAAAVQHFLEEVGANPGRSAHRQSVESARIVYAAREAVAALFNAPDPLRVVFGLNVTDAINTALHGLLKPGDHVITSSLEHNSVMRPLRDLEGKGVELTQVACQPDGTLEPRQVDAAVRANTRLIVLNHASNVCGTILPVRQVGEIARRNNLLLLVDAAQSAGVLPIDMQADGIDLLAFTGHKSLYGPMGVGGLVIGKRLKGQDFQPTRQGGTGSRSESEEQPEFFPDRLEAGTPNAPGIAGLLAALNWLQRLGIERVRIHKQALCAQLLEGLAQIPGVTLYGTHHPQRQTTTVAFNIAGLEPSTAGERLDEQFNILCRVGLHCAPAAHRTLGTFPRGCIRFGLGAFNTPADVEEALQAVWALAREAA